MRSPATRCRRCSGELKRYFRDSAWAVHVPRGVKERAVELSRTTDELSSRLGRSPSLTELAEALGASEEQTLEAIEAYHARHASPLDAGPDDDDSAMLSPAQMLGAEDERLEQAEYLSMIAAGVETLSDTDRLILFLRFGRDMTQSEIARPDRDLADAGLAAAARGDREDPPGQRRGRRG